MTREELQKLIEPGLSLDHEDGVLASIAISLKRLADYSERSTKAAEESVKQTNDQLNQVLNTINPIKPVGGVQ